MKNDLSTLANHTDEITVGIDIGSISINTVILDKQKKVRFETYTYCHGRPFEQLRLILDELLEGLGNPKDIRIALTGSGGKLASEVLGGGYVNEVISQSVAIGEFHPEVKTIIEMGGEDSKLILMDGSNTGTNTLADFELNTVCAAGTGSFLDQQANRIGVSIEKEFGELALKSKNPPRIAGRCSVFAKSDMIHLQQIATPVHDIVAGLCFAVARNFVSTLGRGCCQCRHDPGIHGTAGCLRRGYYRTRAPCFDGSHRGCIEPDSQNFRIRSIQRDRKPG
jgi:activator of 2-hydroxyglutaryl-CoA dehydratase